MKHAKSIFYLFQNTSFALYSGLTTKLTVLENEPGVDDYFESNFSFNHRIFK